MRYDPRRVWVPVWIGVALAAAVGVSSPEAAAGEEGSPTEITPECRRSIDSGNKWLISMIRVDGKVGPDSEQPPELGCTAIVGLALLAEGNTPLGGRHHKELRRVLHGVLDLLDRGVDKVLAQETLVKRKIGRHAELFIAALFLTQVYGEAPDDQKDIQRALDAIVDAICRAQGADGTWGQESWAPVLGTVLGWESLRAASSCGMRIDASAKQAGEALLKQLRNQGGDTQGWMHDFYKSAASIRVLHSLGYRDDPICRDCVKRIFEFAKTDSRPFEHAGGEEYLAFYLVSECLLKDPDKTRQAWYPIVSKNLIRVQNSDGSWSGHHCITGRTFCTAAALMTLQSRNFCLPMSDF
jgi:hypothetical protein